MARLTEPLMARLIGESWGMGSRQAIGRGRSAGGRRPLRGLRGLRRHHRRALQQPAGQGPSACCCSWSANFGIRKSPERLLKHGPDGVDSDPQMHGDRISQGSPANSPAQSSPSLQRPPRRAGQGRSAQAQDPTGASRAPAPCIRFTILRSPSQAPAGHSQTSQPLASPGRMKWSPSLSGLWNDS